MHTKVSLNVRHRVVSPARIAERTASPRNQAQTLAHERVTRQPPTLDYGSTGIPIGDAEKLCETASSRWLPSCPNKQTNSRPLRRLGPVANIDTKLLIYGLFQKGRVLAQDGEWMKQVARNLTDMWDGFLLGKRYLIHDRDPLFTEAVRGLLRDSGVKPSDERCDSRLPHRRRWRRMRCQLWPMRGIVARPGANR